MGEWVGGGVSMVQHIGCGCDGKLAGEGEVGVSPLPSPDFAAFAAAAAVAAAAAAVIDDAAAAAAWCDDDDNDDD